MNPTTVIPLADDQALLYNRAETVQRLVGRFACDVLVVGGGIQGATMAHLLALNGFSTVLLERRDYASVTSSRSSKLAHGGVRYLEFLDFSQVLEGVRDREDLFKVAPHYVQPHEFAFPIFDNEPFKKLQVRAGLWIYALLSRSQRTKMRWRGGGKEEWLPPHTRGYFAFTDGIMNDTRVVLERVLAARQEGALCLNYAQVNHLLRNGDGSFEVRWSDQSLASAPTHSFAAGVIINCTGPWVASHGAWGRTGSRRIARFSRGSHILYDVPWKGPPLVLPIRERGARQRGAYYFVTPCAQGTLVGTTEREVSAPSEDPIPSVDEIEEIHRRVRADLPDAGLEPARAYFAYAGERTLPSNGGAEMTYALSRRHHWIAANGIFSLVGGKYTSAVSSAWKGLKILLAQTEQEGSFSSVRGRILPGSANLAEHVRAFEERCLAQGVERERVNRAVERLGSRVRYLLADSNLLEPLGDSALRGEVVVACAIDQAVTLRDVMERRLQLHLTPGGGVRDARLIAAAMPHLTEEERLIQLDEYRTWHKSRENLAKRDVP